MVQDPTINYPVYQDVWLHGRHIRNGMRECHSRYRLISGVIQELPLNTIKVLDLGASTGYFSIRLVEDYPHITCIVRDTVPYLPNIIRLANNPRPTLNPEPVTPKNIEPADVILALNFIHWFDNWQEFYARILQQTKTCAIFQVPYYNEFTRNTTHNELLRFIQDAPELKLISATPSYPAIKLDRPIYAYFRTWWPISYQSYLNLLAWNNGISIKQAQELPELKFPIDNRNRGKAIIKILQNILGESITGKKLLDIGCGHGGLTIEASLAGAEAHGIEYHPQCYKYALENNKDEGQAKFIQLDASNYRLQALYPPGYFDIIVLFDVFEHIYDTQALLINIQHCLRNGGLLYFCIPNGWSLEYVPSEGHYKGFSLSIMDPDCWQFIPNTPKRHSVYYRRWELYDILLRHYIGVPRIRHDFYPASSFNQDTLNTYITKRLRIINQHNIQQYPAETQNILNDALDKYYAELNQASSDMSVEEFHWNFIKQFWEGYIFKT